MATDQIFVESTYDEFTNNLFIIEQLSSDTRNKEVMNFCPSILVTSDSIISVFWSCLGNFQFQTAEQTICIQNPLLVSRNDAGVFSVDRAVPVIDKNNNPITDFEFPVVCATSDNRGAMIFGFKDGALQLYVGYVEQFSGINTYQVLQQVFISDTVNGQKVSVVKGSDGRIVILFVNSDGNFDGLVTGDYGNTFNKYSVDNYNVQQFMTAILSKQTNTELMFFTTDNSQLSFVVASSEDVAGGTINTPGLFTSFIVGSVISDIDSTKYPGAFFDYKFNNSIYAAVLQDKSNSSNNSNIIVAKSDDCGKTFSNIKE